MENVFKINTKPVRTMNLSVLAEQCVYRLPGCSDLMLRKELQKVIVEMCERTSAMSFTVSFEVKPNETRYYIAIPCDLVHCRIESVTSSDPKGYSINNDNVSVEWEPYPCLILDRAFADNELSSEHPLEVTVVINAMPALGNDDYPESFLKRWQSTIISGTLANLFMMTGKPWTDVACGAIEANAYNNGLNDIAIRRITGGIHGHSYINKASGNKSHWFI